MTTNMKLIVEIDNHALPEVHVEGADTSDEKPDEGKAPHMHIRYDTAVPEVTYDDE